MSRFEHVRYEVRDGVAYIALERPEALNAFTTRFYSEVRDAVRLADADRAVRVMVLSGTEKAFGTGGDLKEMLSYLGEDADPLDVYRFEDAVPFHAIRTSPKVVISAVRGLCVGGGLVIACESDITLGAHTATFSAPEARVGVADSFTPAPLAHRVGMAKLKYLLLTGARIDAEEAERIGLITEAVPEERLFDRVAEIAEQVKACSPEALSGYKRILNSWLPRGQGADMWPIMRSANGREGMTAFAEGREPDYRAE